MNRQPNVRAFYFGTYQRPGHYMWDENWRDVGHPRVDETPGPWGWPDGKLHPRAADGIAAIHHKDGWTAVAFMNRAWDSRPSCNSAFLFDAELTFDEAMVLARKKFGHVLDQLPFDVRLAEGAKVA